MNIFPNTNQPMKNFGRIIILIILIAIIYNFV